MAAGVAAMEGLMEQIENVCRACTMPKVVCYCGE